MTDIAQVNGSVDVADSSDGGLASVMDRVARTLHQTLPLQDLLDLIVASCRDTVPGVEQAAISIIRRNDKIETVAATAPVIFELDAIQYDLSEGPCHDAIRGRGQRCVQDLALDDRWPAYAPKAVALGIRSQMGIELYDVDDTIGGLNLYSSQPDAFGPETAEIGYFFATHAAHALGRTVTRTQLTEGMGTRKLIGQAIGIVMERYGMNEERAFAFLTRVSQTSNTKLRDVAAELVEQGNQAAQSLPAQP